MTTSIIHISDLHFHTYPQNFQDWKSKRILGAANLFLRRKRYFPFNRAKRLVDLIQKMNWDHLVISGDLTQLALEKEFTSARKTLDPLLSDPKRVTVIPGNHDRYVRQVAGPDLFKKYFGEFFGQKEIHIHRLNSDWVIIGWDSAHPNGWSSAAGTVRRSTLKATDDLLKKYPEKTQFIIVNHYPLTFPEGWKYDRLHELYNLVPVKNWILSHYQIRLYLHGHIHKNWLHRIPRDSGPELLLLNSAASTSTLHSGQKSSFHQIDLNDNFVKISPILLN